MAKEPKRDLLTRRDALFLPLKAYLGVQLLNNLVTPRLVAHASTVPRPSDIPEVTQFLIRESAKFGVPDNIGYRVSNAWQGEDGWYYGAWQGAILQTNGKDTTQLWNILDEMHAREMDGKLANGSLGVTIPPHEDFADGASGDTNKAFEVRSIHFNIPPEIDQVARKVRQSFEIGTPTAFPRVYPDANGNSVYEVARYQRMAYMHWLAGPNKGIVQRILVGDAAKDAGIVPKEVWLAQPDMKTAPEPVAADPLESFIAASRITDQVTFDRDHRLEVRSSTDSRFSISLNPDTRQQLTSLVGESAAQFNYEKIEVITVNSPDATPVDWPVKGNVQINLGHYRGTGIVDLHPIGAFNVVRVKDDLLFFFAPVPGLKLSDPAIAQGVNEAISDKLFTATYYNGNLTVPNPLFGKTDYIQLTHQSALQLSQSPTQD